MNQLFLHESVSWIQIANRIAVLFTFSVCDLYRLDTACGWRWVQGEMQILQASVECQISAAATALVDQHTLVQCRSCSDGLSSNGCWQLHCTRWVSHAVTFVRRWSDSDRCWRRWWPRACWWGRRCRVCSWWLLHVICCGQCYRQFQQT